VRLQLDRVLMREEGVFVGLLAEFVGTQVIALLVGDGGSGVGVGG
jgi:hypothetical protein